MNAWVGREAPERSRLGIGDLLRRPSGWVPLALPLVAGAVVAAHLALSGTARAPDEGAAAHVWQLLMAGQVVALALFAVLRLPRAGRPAVELLAWQLLATAAAVAPVWYFHL